MFSGQNVQVLPSSIFSKYTRKVIVQDKILMLFPLYYPLFYLNILMNLDTWVYRMKIILNAISSLELETRKHSDCSQFEWFIAHFQTQQETHIVNLISSSVKQRMIKFHHSGGSSGNLNNLLGCQFWSNALIFSVNGNFSLLNICHLLMHLSIQWILTWNIYINDLIPAMWQYFIFLNYK